jgi:hypothetical protein
MEKNILETIEGICLSDELTDSKVNMIYEIIGKELGRDKGIPTNDEMFKLAKKIIKKENLNITKLKLSKDGNFKFLVYHNYGCHGDWSDEVILTPFMFYKKVIKPNLK